MKPLHESRNRCDKLGKNVIYIGPFIVAGSEERKWRITPQGGAVAFM